MACVRLLRAMPFSIVAAVAVGIEARDRTGPKKVAAHIGTIGFYFLKKFLH